MTAPRLLDIPNEYRIYLDDVYVQIQQLRWYNISTTKVIYSDTTAELPCFGYALPYIYNISQRTRFGNLKNEAINQMATIFQLIF